MSVDDWEKVMWSDESTFQCIQSRKRRVRRPSSICRMDPAYTISTVKHPASVMVWGCFSGTLGRGGLYFLPKNVTMNGERYIGVLENHLLDMMTIHGCTIFMQDGAPCHTAKKVMKWLADKKIDVMEWPGNSPDLNPIENVWNIMKHEMQSCHISSVPLLQQRIKDIWVKELTPEFFRNLAVSMPKRLQSVIKAKGHTTKY